MGGARIQVVLCSRDVLRWHLWLLEALLQIGPAAIELRGIEARDPVPTSAQLLLQLERLLGADRSGGALEQVSLDDCASLLGNRAAAAGLGTDVIIDLSGSTSGMQWAPRVIRPLYNGRPGLSSALASVLGDGERRVGIDDSRHGMATAGLIAQEEPSRLGRSADQLLSRTAELLAQSCTKPLATSSPTTARTSTMAGSTSPHHESGMPGLGGRVSALALQRLVLRPLNRLVRQAPRWRIGWRRTSAGEPPLPQGFCRSKFATIADDGKRYLADPFVIERHGRHFVFCEELPYATGRGLISVIEIGADGRVQAPRPVLERPYHLSYPHVFEHGGQTWMIPESSANGRIELFRAIEFPHRWEPEAVLLEGNLHDATVFAHQGRLWMTAATARWRSSSWDGLGLYSADTLTGPWRAHPGNPVIVDVCQARPAGAIVRHGADLWRPVQDCSKGYGSALRLARISRLDLDAFTQEAGPALRIANEIATLGPHTWNRGGDLEVIDFCSLV